MTALSRLDRARSGEQQNLPRPTGAPDIVTVETTWGALQPVAGIRTVGELEVVDLVENGAQLVDTRVPDALRLLSEAGCPLDRLAYYRGGMHDWMTLGMPTHAV